MKYFYLFAEIIIGLLFLAHAWFIGGSATPKIFFFAGLGGFCIGFGFVMFVVYSISRKDLS